MFHNHATPRHVYITTDKLRLNKLSQTTTHLYHVKPLSPNNMEQCVTSASTHLNFLECYWVPPFPRSAGQLKWQVSCHIPALPNAGFCRSWNSYDQLLAAPYKFLVVERDQLVWNDCSLCTAEKIRHPRIGHEVASFCCMKRGGNDPGD
jgi:hypothetical protein